MLITIENLRKYEQDGLIYSQVHPELDLIIWNYSDACQYKQAWDMITLRCRALVTDTEGKRVNNPIPKFFNYSETLGKYACDFKHPFKVFTKYDGSYIQMFKYKGQTVVTSRGSFTSDQVGFAKEIGIPDIEDGFTYIFELIHPQNRIVVNYGDQKKLVLLAVRSGTGIEHDLQDYADKFEIADTHSLNIKKYKDLKSLPSLNIPNEEGYVFLFASGKRCKVKFEEYLVLHRLVTDISTKTIWRCLREGKDLNELLANVPDEAYAKIKTHMFALNSQFYSIYGSISSAYGNIVHELGETTDKEFAERIKDEPYKHQLFSLRQEKDISDWIWQKIEPEYIRL